MSSTDIKEAVIDWSKLDSEGKMSTVLFDVEVEGSVNVEDTEKGVALVMEGHQVTMSFA